MAKKTLKRGLALGALMAFVITGSAMAAATICQSTGSNDDVSIKGNYDIGIYYNGGSTIDFNGSQITVDILPGTGWGSGNVAVWASSNASNQSVINLGKAGITDSININVVDNSNAVDQAVGLWADGDNNKHGGLLNVNTKNLTVTGESNIGWMYGIYAQNRTVDPGDKSVATLVINADNTTVDVKSGTSGQAVGILAMSNGILEINSNLKVNADRALVARGDAIVRINTDGLHSTVFNGDIDFDYDAATSGTKVDADVNINFAGAESALNGKISITGNPPSGKDTVSGMKLQFNNGATWNLSGASMVNDATFGAGSSLVIDGTKFTGADYAITGKVTMDPTANLVIQNSASDTNYKVVKGENNISDANLSYDRTALVAVENTDGVYEVEFKSIANATESELAAAQDKAVTANGGDALVAPSIISGAMSPSASAESKALASAITQMSGTAEQKAAIINDIAQIGEKAGNTTNAVNIVNNVTGITNQRMSFTNINTAPQGGHGKVERKYKSGAGIWAQYMHGKDKVDDLPGAGGTTSSYESQYNGAVIGYDFKEVGKTKTGIAFNYGEGDSHSKDAAVKTNNDFDFWGIGLYHSIMNEDTNLIFDINYNKTDADVTQVVPGYGKITVNPNTTAISAGVRAEKLIQNGPVQIVPYIGARFLSIDTDEYTSSTGTKFSPDRQNIWLVPVGVSLRQENTYENGWKVTPKADLSYIWALGDTDSSMNVATGVKVDNLAYTVMDDGSFLGTVGIEAEKGDWTYGLSYSYQKGEYQRSDKWFVDVRYSF